MQISRPDSTRLGLAGAALLLTACTAPAPAPDADAAPRVGAGELGGVVTSAQGPEAGVWVIAETNDLPTKFTKISGYIHSFIVFLVYSSNTTSYKDFYTNLMSNDHCC